MIKKKAPRPRPLRDPADYQTSCTEVADTLGVTAATVRNWCADKRIPAVRHGPRARWRIRNDWLDLFSARVMDAATRSGTHA